MLEYYNRRRNFLKNNILIPLSMQGFAAHCDYAICDRFGSEIHFDPNCIRMLKNNDKLFINLITFDNIDLIVSILNEINIKLDFYLMKEPIVEEYIISKLLPHSNKIFVLNNTHHHPKIFLMPLGIRDGEETFLGHRHFSQKYIIQESNTKRDKKTLCLMCYTTGSEARIACDEALQDKKFILNLNCNQYERQPSIHCGKVPVWIFYQNCHESYYTLAPVGYGSDTHRFYESIYLNSVPIVKRTNTTFDELYKKFPCLVVDDWNQVTEDFLETNKELKFNELIKFKFDNPDLFSNLDKMDCNMQKNI